MKSAGAWGLALAFAIGCSGCGANEDANTGGDAKAGADKSAADAASAAEQKPAPEKKLESIPATYHGTWDFPGEGSCGEYSDTVMHIEADRVSYYEGFDRLNTIRQIDPDTIAVDATFTFFDDAPDDQTYRLKLSEDGRVLVATFNDGKPTRMERCKDAKAKASASAPAPTNTAAAATIPAAYRGKWAFGDTSGCSAADFRDLVVEAGHVKLGKGKDTITKIEPDGPDGLKLTAKSGDGTTSAVYLALTDNGRSIAYGAPGMSGMTFRKCPN
jgi:hypothetical protein